jgi:hypothetical protein
MKKKETQKLNIRYREMSQVETGKGYVLTFSILTAMPWRSWLGRFRIATLGTRK